MFGIVKSLHGTVLLGSVLMLAFGCGGSTTVEDESVVSQPSRARNGNLNRGYETESSDFNFDGTPDQLTYISGGQAIWTERDFDFDGRMDLFEHYDSAGQIAEQEFQLDFDDAIDVVRFYVAGVLVRKELATGFDSTPTMFKYYAANGALLRVERDRDADGIIDQVGYYEAGELVRIGIDLTGDGIPDDVEAY